MVENFAQVTVLFAGRVAFTQIASDLSPIKLVDLLNQIFSSFDRLTEKHSLDKVQTMGNAYRVVSGLPNRRADHTQAIAALAQFNRNNHQVFSIRIGSSWADCGRSYWD